MWCLLRPLNSAVVGPQNEFTGSRAPSIPYDIDVQVVVKRDFSERFDRDKFDGRFIDKVELHYIC